VHNIGSVPLNLEREVIESRPLIEFPISDQNSIDMPKKLLVVETTRQT
jgi:hypothetical protein